MWLEAGVNIFTASSTVKNFALLVAISVTAWAGVGDWYLSRLT